MKKGAVLLMLGLMSWTMAGSAFAGPFGRFPRARVPQQQRVLPRSSPEDADVSHDKERGDHVEKNANSPQGTPHGDVARGEAPRSPEIGQGNAQQPPAMPGGRAGARMSLEERQKLRRQINEAGRSLYTPSPDR